MHTLMKRRKKWGPHILRWPQPISLSFSNMCLHSMFYTNRKLFGDSEVFGTMFSIHLLVKRERAACPSSNDRRMAVETSSLGEKIRCYSQGRQGAEKAGVETKMCLFMPTGVLTILQAVIAFCQERELKGHSHTWRLPLLSNLHFIPSYTVLTPLRSALIPSRCWKGNFPVGMYI